MYYRGWWRGWDERDALERGFTRRKVEGFGKLGRNIRDPRVKRVGRVIRWLMVRLEFHEALVERDVWHYSRKISKPIIFYFLLDLDRCSIFSCCEYYCGMLIYIYRGNIFEETDFNRWKKKRINRIRLLTVRLCIYTLICYVSIGFYFRFGYSEFALTYNSIN